MADVGARLRASREGKRLSLDAVAATTRVQSRVLSAIERNDAGALPPRPYGRGFVRAYARELGLNPDEIVRDYFGQFAPEEAPQAAAPPRAQPVFEVQPVLDALPRRSIAIATLALVLLAGGWMLARRTGGPTPSQQDAVGTSGTAATPPAPAAAAESRPATPGAPTAAVTIILSATAPCWVTASADGTRVLYRALQPGEHATLQGDRTISIRAGNAGGLVWTLNGRAMGPFGSPGEVRTTRITPNSVKVVASSAEN